MRILSGLFRASESNWSEQSSQILCRALKAPYSTREQGGGVIQDVIFPETSTHLTLRELGAVYELAQGGQELGPVDQLPSHGNGADQRPCSGPDERGRVPNGMHRLLLHKGLDLLRERGPVDLHVVLEDEPGHGSGGLILTLQLGEDKHQVVVEVRVLVQSLQLL